jgi:ligand-binding sensor domain-containing protein
MLFKKTSCYIIGLLVVSASFFGCNPDPEEPNPPLYDIVKGFVIDANDTKIVASNTGLFSFKDNTWKEITVQDANATIFNDMFMREGTTWLATNAGVLNHSAGTSINTSNSCLSSDQVSQIFVDESNILFLATDISVSVIDGDNCFETLGRDDLYANHKITDIGTSSNDYTYVTTDGGGIGRFKYDVDGITGATLFDEDWTALETNHINTVFIDDTSQWYGSNKGAAFHFSHKTKSDWETYHINDGLISDTVISIAKDLDENMWFGTYRGISRFDGTTWTNYDVNSHNIINDTVSFISVAGNGSVWIATKAGLSEFTGTEWINYSNIEENEE